MKEGWEKAPTEVAKDAYPHSLGESDYSLDYNKLALGDLPPKDPMKIVRSYVEEKKHVTGVHILIGAFMETFWSAYFQLWDGQEKSFRYWGTGNEEWESTTYGDAAKYTAAVALDRNAVGTQKFLGDKKNIFDIAQAFEKVYGLKPKMQCQGSLDDLHATMHKIFAKDPSNVYAWLAFFYQYHSINGQAYISSDLDNKKYPQVKPRTFEDFLNDHALKDLPNAMDNLSKRD